MWAQVSRGPCPWIFHKLQSRYCLAAVFSEFDLERACFPAGNDVIVCSPAANHVYIMQTLSFIIRNGLISKLHFIDSHYSVLAQIHLVTHGPHSYCKLRGSISVIEIHPHVAEQGQLHTQWALQWVTTL